MLWCSVNDWYVLLKCGCLEILKLNMFVIFFYFKMELLGLYCDFVVLGCFYSQSEYVYFDEVVYFFFFVDGQVIFMDYLVGIVEFVIGMVVEFIKGNEWF